MRFDTPKIAICLIAIRRPSTPRVTKRKTRAPERNNRYQLLVLRGACDTSTRAHCFSVVIYPLESSEPRNPRSFMLKMHQIFGPRWADLILARRGPRPVLVCCCSRRRHRSRSAAITETHCSIGDDGHLRFATATSKPPL